MKTNLKNHIENIHERIKNFFCDFCGFGAYNKAILLNHIRSHFPGRLKCLQCDFATTTEALLRSHVVHTHEEHKGRPRVRCSECNKDFCSNNYLNEHILRRHRQLRDSKCDDCGKFFFSLDDLKFVIIRNIFKA